jgi:predicted nucleic acid-binding Zn finger protein
MQELVIRVKMADKNCEYILKENVCGTKDYVGNVCDCKNYFDCSRYETQKLLDNFDKEDTKKGIEKMKRILDDEDFFD